MVLSRQIGVASLAAQFNLPVAVTDTVIKDRLGTLLRAKLKNGEGMKMTEKGAWS